MDKIFDVSVGSLLHFEYDGTPSTGWILNSKVSLTMDFVVEVCIVTKHIVPEGAQLRIPDLKHGLGLAHPKPGADGLEIILLLPYSKVNRDTIGK